jgi:hypothetical protein
VIQTCVDFLAKLGGSGDAGGSDNTDAHAEHSVGQPAPFALYCSVLDPHPPYWTNSSWIDQIDTAALDVTINATRWQPLAALHPADTFQ